MRVAPVFAGDKAASDERLCAEHCQQTRTDTRGLNAFRSNVSAGGLGEVDLLFTERADILEHAIVPLVEQEGCVRLVDVRHARHDDPVRQAHQLVWLRDTAGDEGARRRRC